MYDVICTELNSYSLLIKLLEDIKPLNLRLMNNGRDYTGGRTINTPAALAGLGINVAFSTIFRRDLFREELVKYFENSGVDISASIVNDELNTGISDIQCFESDYRFNLYSVPKNNKSLISKIDSCMKKSIHIHTYLVDCLSTPIIRMAEEKNLCISIDINWVGNIRLRDVSYILKKCHVVFADSLEACQLTGCNKVDDAVWKIGKYSGIAVVRLDDNGSLVRFLNRIVHIPAVEGMEFKKAANSGDLYSAGFIYGLIHNWSLKKTCLFASASQSYAAQGIERYNFTNILKQLPERYR